MGAVSNRFVMAVKADPRYSLRHLPINTRNHSMGEYNSEQSFICGCSNIVVVSCLSPLANISRGLSAFRCEACILHSVRPPDIQALRNGKMTGSAPRNPEEQVRSWGFSEVYMWTDGP